MLLQQTTIIYPQDGFGLIYPNYYYISESLQNGELPIWNPYIFGGTPQIINPGIGLFYPFNLLFCMLPWSGEGLPYYALDYLIILHIFICGISMYCFGKSRGLSRFSAFGMALFYMFSSNIMAHIGWIYTVMAFAWLPFVLLYLLRITEDKNNMLQNTGFCGIFMGLLCSAAPAQAAIMALFLAGVYIVVAMFANRKDKKQMLRIFLCGVLVLMAGVLMAAPSLLSAVQGQDYTVRFLGEDGMIASNEKIPIEGLTKHKLPLEQLLGTIIYDYSNITVGSAFLGLITLFLAIYSIIRTKGIFVKFLFGVIIFSYFYALGIGLPYIIYYIPLLNMLREPSTYLLYISLAMAILAGFGLEQLLNDVRNIEDQKKKKRFLKIQMVLLLLGCGLIIGGIAIGWSKRSLASFSAFVVMIIGICTVAVFYFEKKKVLIKRIGYLLIGIAIVGEMIIVPYSVRAVPSRGEDELSIANLVAHVGNTFDIENEIKHDSNIISEVASEEEIYRIRAVELETTPYSYNMAILNNAYETFGYGNPVLARIVQMRDTYSIVSIFDSLLNTKYFIANENSIERLYQALSNDEQNRIKRKTINDESIFIYENPSRCGNVWLVDNIVYLDKFEYIMDAFESGKYSPQETALIEEAVATGVTEIGELNYSVDITEYKNNYISYQVSSSKSAMMVMSEVYYPGWHAYINGERQKVYQVDGILRGVVVPEGESMVEFRFEPITVYGGIGFAFCALLSCMCFILSSRIKTKRGNRILKYIGLGLIFICMIGAGIIVLA